MRYTTLVPITTLVLAFISCDRSPAPAESLDRRTAVVLPPEPFEAVHAEMRTMLTSLHQIHLGLARSDTALVRQAAVASGVANAEDPELEHLLPAEFLRLAVETHSSFDRLADAVGRGQPGDSLVAHLSRITVGCTGCHAIYRLAPGQPDRAR